MIFNGEDLTGLFVIQKISRGLSPAQVHVRQAIPGRDGTIEIRRNDADRRIDIEIALLADSREEYLKAAEELAGFLIFDGEKELVLDDEPDRTYLAVLDGSTDMNELQTFGEGRISFLCRPYKLGDEVTFQDGDPYGLMNYGTMPTPFVATLTLHSPTNSLVLTIGTQSIQIDYAFAGTEVVIIDSEHENITIDGANAISAMNIGSDMFYVPVGEQEVSVTPIDTDIEVVIRERWR